MIRKQFLLLYLIMGVVSMAFGQSLNLPTEATGPTAPSSPTIPVFSNYNDLNTTSPKLNYTRTYQPFNRVAALTPLTTGLSIVSIYQNGWGQPIEKINNRILGIGDVVTPIDQRASLLHFSMVPYRAPFTGGFHFDPCAEQQSEFASPSNPWYNEGGFAFGTDETFAYGTGVVFNKTNSPGLAMVGSDRGTTTSVTYNTSTSGVYKMDIVAGYAHVNGTYDAGELSIKETLTPHGEVEEFYDKNNQLIQKRVNDGNAWLTTYYVYNDKGKLCWILTPKVWSTITGTGWALTWPLSDGCYFYAYNVEGRLAESHTADQTGNSKFFYDSKGRLVLSSTPMLRPLGKWMFTVYDKQDRARYGGIFTTTVTENDLGNRVRAASTPDGTVLDYLSNGFDTYPSSLANCEINQYNYYDDYTSLPAPLSSITSPSTAYNSYFLTGGNFEAHNAQNTWAYGLLTGSRARVMDASGQWVSNVYFYDDFGRLVQTHTLNPVNGSGVWDIALRQYTFTGDPALDIMEHNSWTASDKAGKTVVQTKYEYYTSTNKLLAVNQKIDGGGWRELARYSYDYMGRVSEKAIGGVEKQVFAYNIRGQLASINDKYVKDPATTFATYGERLCYDYGFSDERYDGSMAGFIWRGPGASKPYAYGYHYDYAGRFKGADFMERSVQFTSTSISSWSNINHDYSVSNVSYDLNGNMSGMKQRGYDAATSSFVDIDDMTYNYFSNTNKLSAVTDAHGKYTNDFEDLNKTGDDYDYDADGNLTMDKNKGITNISYNYQDLPVSVTQASASIDNVYDATGVLLKKTVTTSAGAVVHRYFGPIEYVDDHLLEIQHAEGVNRYTGGDFALDFFVKDHLGNVRSVVNSVVTDLANGYGNRTATFPPGGIGAPPAPEYEYHLGFEVMAANLENSLFTSVDSMRELSPLGTPGDLMSGYLDGSDPDHRIGAAILLHLMAGDEITFKSYGYYEEADSASFNTYSEPNDMMGSLISTLAGGSNGLDLGEMGNMPGVPTGTLTGLISPANYDLYEAMKSDATDPAYPRTYLNHLVFDEMMNLIPDQSHVVQLRGGPGTWSLMNGGDNMAHENGYSLIYMSNESATRTHIDNTHIYTVVGTLQQDQNYYPHGLHIAGSLRTGASLSDYLYQGKKLQHEAGLELHDFHARQYDAQIGRFWGIDPMNQFPSGYTGMGNNPANMVDPTGMKANLPTGPVPGGGGAQTDQHPDAVFGRVARTSSFIYRTFDATGEAHYFDALDAALMFVVNGGSSGGQGGGGVMLIKLNGSNTAGVDDYNMDVYYSKGDQKGSGGGGSSAMDEANDIVVSASDYANILKKHYKTGGGADYHISIWRFHDMLDEAQRSGGIDYEKAVYNSETNSFNVPVNFYGTDYWASYGRATMSYKLLEDGKPAAGNTVFTGFNDYWDLDSKPWGVRSYAAEGITRWYNSTLTGKNFHVSYP